MKEKNQFVELLKNFKVLLIIVAAVGAVFTAVYFIKLDKIQNTPSTYYESPNKSRVYGDRRVFDYGNQLTDSEEKNLEQYIHNAEKKTCCDIVIVTLNESLKDFAPEYKANYNMAITPDKYVMVYADKFWEDNKFGYDSPQILDGTTNTGDGVLLVDNVFREPETNKIYTWMCTTGIVEDKFSSSMIDYTLDAFYERIDYDYYGACIDFVDKFVSYMTPDEITLPGFAFPVFNIIIGLIIFIVSVATNHKAKAGAVTTNNVTYIIGKEPNFLRNEDVLVNKSVSRVYDPPSSSSSGGGGGGHHSSGGGGSHGGGGHSR